MDNNVVQIIVRYLEQLPDHMELMWSDHQIEEMIFSKWAAETILNEILDHPQIPALDTVEEFIFKMRFYAARTSKKHFKQIYSIAAETGIEIHDGV